MADEITDPLRKLQILQRDLRAFADKRLQNVQRLGNNLQAAAEELKTLLERNKRRDSSRKTLVTDTNPQPTTITIDESQYQISDQFRHTAIQVADELDLDEIEAAKLCLASMNGANGHADGGTLAMQAVVRFHEYRDVLLDCLRIVMSCGVSSDYDENVTDFFRDFVKQLVQSQPGGPDGTSAFCNRCLDGLADIENYMAKVAASKDKLLVVGQGISGLENDFLVTQRLLLTKQHESLVAILSYLISDDRAQVQDFKRFVKHAASLEAAFDITTHYLPVICTGAEKFAPEHMTDASTVQGLHELLVGEGQNRWKQDNFRAAAMVCWLSEYNARFATALDPGQSDGEQQPDKDARSRLFFDALKNHAFHYMLAAAAALKPELWHDPARTSIINYLTGSALIVSSDAPRPSEEFSAFAMSEFQKFTEAFVENMHEALRLLRAEEEDRRRILFSSMDNSPQSDFDMERFIAIMACAYQDDSAAAEHLWSDRGGNLYGFLRWVSSRLTTPGVSAFCLLLKSMACDEKSANNAHRFLLEDTTMASGKLRKTFGISWALIQKELDIYASSVKDQVSAPGQASAQARSSGELYYEGEDTAIMLDAYLGLTTWICQHSPEARSWLLSAQQSFHIGDTMFQLAKTAHTARLQACCLDVLSALLTDKTLEVRNGVWVSLDAWISSGGLDGSSAPRAAGKLQYSPKHYLQMYANSADSAASMVKLLNMLVTPVKTTADILSDSLPFPETLGSPHRHAGIDAYVDFVLGGVFAYKLVEMQQTWEVNLTNVVRYECLHFALQCLSSFDEDLVVLANTTNIGVESAMETKSLATYVRLHPFARVMEWIFNRDVLASLFATLQQNSDALDTAEFQTPLVQGTLRSLQLLDLAWKLQPTYLDIIRPALSSSTSKAPHVTSTWTSIDEVLLAHLSAVSDIAQLTASEHLDLSLVSLSLLQRIGASRKISQTIDSNGYGAQRSRLLSILEPYAATLTRQLASNFFIQDWDFEEPDSSSLIKAGAVLHLLNTNLEASGGRPCMAHCLLGFRCRERDVDVHPESPLANFNALFDRIVCLGSQSPNVHADTFVPMLLSLQRRSLEVIWKLAVSSISADIVLSRLREMDFLEAFSRHLVPASASMYWDGKPLQDPNVLGGASAQAISDFIHVRESYFALGAIFLRTAAKAGSYSIRERIISALLGTIQDSAGSQIPTISVFDLLDFFDLEMPACPDLSASQTQFFSEVDTTTCVKDLGGAVGKIYDVTMAEKLFVLSKRELIEKGVIRDSDHDNAHSEINLCLFILNSMNATTAILEARLAALEAWTDLMSLAITKGGLDQAGTVALALQGLLVVLPKFEKALLEDPDAVPLFAKLALTLTQAICPASNKSSGTTADTAIERLLSTFRVSLKVITNSKSDLALRDVAYRTCCAVINSAPRSRSNGRSTPATSAKQLLQLVQNAGERVFAVVTEDVFSGRGVTRVSALLFLDGLMGIYQSLKLSASILKGLTKLNFIPVLLDSSIGHIAAAFRGDDEMIAALAYFHTALALLLRLCQTPDGALLVINSGFYQAIDDSKLFSTDPDIGLDIDNAVALKEFYTILAAMLRVITAAVVQKGPQPGRDFLSRNRFSVQAIFKQASRGHALDVANELSKLMFATDYLEVREESLLP